MMPSSSSEAIGSSLPSHALGGQMAGKTPIQTTLRNALAAARTVARRRRRYVELMRLYFAMEPDQDTDDIPRLTEKNMII